MQKPLPSLLRVARIFAGATLLGLSSIACLGEEPISHEGALLALSTLASPVPLDVPWIAQNPQLPRGCEVTSLAMMLRHAGVAADKMTLAEQVKKVPYLANGLYGDPYEGFVGDMYDKKKRGFGVYHGPIKELAERYLPGRIVDLTGVSFDELLTQHVAKNRPVWIISNATFAPVDPTKSPIWRTRSGDVRITWEEHSVVVTGYDQSSVYINDPMDARGKNKKLARTNFRLAWEQMGQQAITYLADAALAPDVAASPSEALAECTAAGMRSATPGDRLRMVERALHWVESGVVHGEASTFEGYRTDGGGLVSMAWELPSSRATWQLAPFDLATSHAIGRNDLMPGDALNRHVAAHGGQTVMLFGGWLDAARTRACVVGLNQPGARANVGVVGIADGGLAELTPIRFVGAPGETQGGVRGLRSDCSVHGDGKLYCMNRGGAALRATPSATSPVVNRMRTTYSWFDCWAAGERHAGGNTTWYHSLGDDNPNEGWVAGVDLMTPDHVDANPTAHGLARCALPSGG